MTPADIIRTVQPVTRAFDELQVPHYIGGSVASSVYGIARATLDVDLVAGIEARHISPLIRALRSEYYIDKLMITEAIERRTSINLIDLATSMKIDVFVPAEGDYPQAAMHRRRQETLEEADERFCVCTAEDILLSKLQRYELGGRASERQWSDIIGVIKVQGGALDNAYLERWGRELGLSALLRKAFADGGVQFP